MFQITNDWLPAVNLKPALGDPPLDCCAQLLEFLWNGLPQPPSFAAGYDAIPSWSYAGETTCLAEGGKKVRRSALEG